MNPEHPVRELTVELPPHAPQVRVTAGLGSAGQKTWNLRRPVTLIGAKRPAHIVLHDNGISNAHCVIVNTGTEILLRDLSTSGGTYVNGQRSDLVVLKDGDLLRIGETQIQLAIRLPESRPDDSGCGIKYADPTRFIEPVLIQLAYTDMKWKIDQAVVLIGKHEAAMIRLDHEDLSARHAVLFRFLEGPAIFDISDGGGLSVNDQPCSLTPLFNGDKIKLGPFTLEVSQGVGTSGASPSQNGRHIPQEDLTVESRVTNAPILPAEPRIEIPAAAPQQNVEQLSDTIRASWDELNELGETHGAANPAVAQKIKDLQAREAELDARDAALRGKLHDVTRYHEQVMERERDLGAMAARIQADADELANSEKSFQVINEKLDQKAKEVQRREQMLAQRWARMQSLTCPHCGQGVNLGKVE